MERDHHGTSSRRSSSGSSPIPTPTCRTNQRLVLYKRLAGFKTAEGGGDRRRDGRPLRPILPLVDSLIRPEELRRTLKDLLITAARVRGRADRPRVPPRTRAHRLHPRGAEEDEGPRESVPGRAVGYRPLAKDADGLVAELKELSAPVSRGALPGARRRRAPGRRASPVRGWARWPSTPESPRSRRGCDRLFGSRRDRPSGVAVALAFRRRGAIGLFGVAVRPSAWLSRRLRGGGRTGVRRRVATGSAQRRRDARLGCASEGRVALGSGGPRRRR